MGQSISFSDISVGLLEFIASCNRRVINVKTSRDTYESLYHVHSLSSQRINTSRNVNLSFVHRLVQEVVNGDQRTSSTDTGAITVLVTLIMSTTCKLAIVGAAAATTTAAAAEVVVVVEE